MAAVIIIGDGRSLIELKRIVKTNLNLKRLIKLSLCKLLFHFNIPFKRLYISSKTEHFSYKGRCGGRGRTHIVVFKRRAGLGYI